MTVKGRNLSKIAMKQMKKNKICSICFKEYEGYGNNASPINSGRCCDSCDGMIVMYARINCARLLIQKSNEKRRTKNKDR